jgi:hypothetical protein
MANTKVAFRRRPHGARRLLQPPVIVSAVLQTGYAAAVNGSDTVPVTVTLGATTVTGGTLLVAVAGFWNSNNFAATQVTDNKGNTFAFDFEVVTAAAESCVAFYSCPNFTGGASHQITVTTTTVIGKCIGVVEYAGVLTFDQSASSVDDTTSPHTSGTTATLTGQPGIAMAAVAIDTGDSATLTPDGDWTQIGERDNGVVDLVNNQVYKLLTATTAEDAGWTWAGSYAGSGAQAGIVTYFELVTPALASSSGSTWAGQNTTTETTGSISWNAGDLIIVVGATEEGDTTCTLNTPTATGLTFTLVDSDSTTLGCFAAVWKASPVAGGSATVSSTHNGSGQAGIYAYVWRGGAVGATAKMIKQDADTVALARSTDRSAVVAVGGDWANLSGAGTVSPTLNGAVDVLDAGFSTLWAAHWTDQGTGGTTSYGLTGIAATTRTTIIAVEIKLPTVAATATLAFRRRKQQIVGPFGKKAMS